MKGMKKIRAGIAAIGFLCASALAGGCFPRPAPDGEAVDLGKSQLYVGNFDGGVGSVWLEELKAAFEAEYAETSFEENKTGVQVILDKKKAGFLGNALLATIGGERDDVFFTEGIKYYDYINKGVLADITDIVTAPLSEYGEEASIAGKMDGQLASYFRTGDGKYYALPFYDAYFGMFYDLDLFDEYGFWLAAGKSAEGVDLGDPSRVMNLFVKSARDARAAGPDGKAGTADDGLPATYADFYALLEYMSNNTVTPLVWTGAYPIYLQRFVNAVWADAAGREEFARNFSLSGTATGLIDPDTRQPVADAAITPSNGYILQKQKAKYDALTFADALVKPGRSGQYYYPELSFSGSLTHTGAQRTFLYSRYKGAGEEIAMLIEGNWWEMESRGVFAELSDKPGFSRAERRIGFMPVPKPAAADVGKPRTVLSSNDSACFISAKSSGVRLELAKKFLRFCHAEAGLRLFNRVVGMARPYEYTMGDADFAGSSYYAREMYNVRKTADIVYEYSDAPVFINNSSFLDPIGIGFSSRVSGADYSNPMWNFHDHADLTPEKYFKGLYDYQSAVWKLA
ncbi:MAG: hypothetical protein LBL66_09915 [Clostridiales bacterium]|jgi:ABC-type glycerol-3-phosphate transport system substrate-binding protein|nr:hypothetical protein [Clostridiales bacterium]